ncbi:MAG TPA: phosphatidate cytidylyltransferase [Burkholderiales bacterium]|nr:phosphatidate cytidylyltransferase [Burkholderiales bacterium]
MLLQRVLTVLAALPLVLAALLLLPNLYWGCLLIAALLVAAWEWGRLARIGPALRLLYCVLLAALCCVILWWQWAGAGRPQFAFSPAGKLLYGAAVVFWLGVAPAWLWLRPRVRNPWLLALVGAVVLVPFWHALVWLQTSPATLLLALSVVWVADTAAYFVGRRFGRHKLAPEVSPGKTWEGVWGAMAAVALYWVVLCAFLPEQRSRPISGLIGVWLMTLLSIVGDLFESWMKRVAGVKDSGTLLPGHGGILDRIDSLTAVMPLVALYFASTLKAA